MKIAKYVECNALVTHIFIANLIKISSTVHGCRSYVCACGIPQLFAIPAASGSVQRTVCRLNLQSFRHIKCDITVPRINQDRSQCTWINIPSLTHSQTHLHLFDPEHNHNKQQLRATVKLWVKMSWFHSITSQCLAKPIYLTIPAWWIKCGSWNVNKTVSQSASFKLTPTR